MGLRMTLHLHSSFIIISIDLRNTLNAIRRAAILRCHLLHSKLKNLLPYIRAKLGPRAPTRALDSTIWHDEGILQRGPISPSAFSYTIHHAVVAADARLVARGDCAMFGMNDGYFIGPREVSLEAL